MMLTPLRSGAVASTTSSSTGTVSSSGGFSTLVAGTPTNGIGQYNTDIAQMAEQNRRALELAQQLRGTGSGTNGMGVYGNSIAEMSQDMSQLLNVQIAMMRENLMFTAISNILKTKHDTVKTIVSNIR